MKSGHTSASRSAVFSLFFGSLGICAAGATFGCASADENGPDDGNGGYAGGAGFPQGGQGGFPQGGAAQGGYPQGGAQGGFPQGGAPQGGAPQGGAPQGGFPQGGLPQGGAPQGGFPQGGGGFVQDTGGAPQGGFNPGTGGEGQAGVPQGTGGAPTTDNKPPCMKSPSQVISMGDSYMNWTTHTFPTDLNTAAGVTFRQTYAIGGFSMGSGGIGLIPTQWDTAIGQDKNIIAVVLDGGGNDILIPVLGSPDCKNMQNSASDPGCQKIVTTGIAASTALMDRMVTGGVHDVIYFFYPHVPAPTALGGSYPNVMLDYALPLVKAACDSAASRTGGKLSCWFVDTIPVFQGHTDWFAVNDIHENSSGSKGIAQAVVDTMKAHCIAQPASSGCCVP